MSASRAQLLLTTCHLPRLRSCLVTTTASWCHSSDASSIHLPVCYCTEQALDTLGPRRGSGCFELLSSLCWSARYFTRLSVMYNLSILLIALYCSALCVSADCLAFPTKRRYSTCTETFTLLSRLGKFQTRELPFLLPYHLFNRLN